MISYWREHRRRRWCLHVQHRAVESLTDNGRLVPADDLVRQVERGAIAGKGADSGRHRIEVTFRGLRLSLPVIDLVTFLGSGPECRWRFMDARLIRRHYALFSVNGALYGIDLSRAQHCSDAAGGTWWDVGTVVRAGGLTLRPQTRVSLPASSSCRDTLPLRLHWNAAGQSQIYALQTEITLMGSSPWNAIRLYDPGVSPIQAALVRQPHSLVLIDLADNTWTRRRGQPVAWSLLDPGDEFEVGRTAFQVSADWEEPATVSPCAAHHAE